MASSFQSGAWSATATSSVLVAANPHRCGLIIQILSAGNTTFLKIGETAVKDSGIALFSQGDKVTLTGWGAKQAIHGVCETAESATGGYQEI